MATLGAEQRFAVSCGQGAVRNEQTCIVHVKLTDSALRTLSGFQLQVGKKPGSQQPVICFEGSRGYIRIPSRHAENGERCFSFDVSSVGDENPQGSLEIIQQPLDSTRGGRLSWLGNVAHKVTVCATDESYRTTQERMTQAEEVARSRSAIVIKSGGPFIGKRVTRKPPAAMLDAAPERKPSAPRNPSAPVRRPGLVSQGQMPVRVQSETAECSRRPIRARVIHLLALAPYHKAELLLRLMSEGLEPAQKEQLGPVLTQVGAPLRDGAYTLQDALYAELQRNWPGYSAEERNNLNGILTRKLENVPQDGEHKSSPMTTSPADRASPTLKRPHNDGKTPLAPKKQRIAHSRAHPSAPTSQTAGKPSAVPESLLATNPKEMHPSGGDGEVKLASKVSGKNPDTDTAKEEGKSKSDLQTSGQGKKTETPLVSSGKKTETPLVSSGKKTETPLVSSGKKTETPLVSSGKKAETPLVSSGKKTETPLVSSGKKTETPLVSSGKKAETPLVSSGKKTETPLVSSGKKTETPLVSSGKKAETPLVSSGKKTETPLVSSGKKAETPLVSSGKKTETPLVSSGKKTETPLVSSGKKTETPLVSSGKKTETPLVSSGKKAETPLVSSGKKAETPLVSSGKKAETPRVSSGKKTETPLVSSGKKTETPLVSSGKKAETPLVSSGKKAETPLVSSGKKAETPLVSSGKKAETPLVSSGKKTETSLLKCGPPGPEHDFLSEYPPLKTVNRRAQYKEDFNEEYAEYRTLHSRIQEVTQHFAKLETQLLALDPNSEQYKIIREKVFHEFEVLKQKHPRYQEEKHHCQYLHIKLAHIKQCIKNYDQSCSATDR